jgi:ribonuclease BN (tRNA processing enzyme)
VRITVLGKSPSWQDADGACSGYLVEEQGFRMLVDCGNGVFAKLRRFVDYPDVDAVVISHLHADHFLDLVPFSYALRFAPGRQPAPGAPEPERPVLHAPPGAQECFRSVTGAWGSEDLIESAFALTEYDPAQVLHAGPLTIRFQPVPHFVPANAIEITSAAGGGRFTFGADSGPSEDLWRFALDTDLLLIEATLPAPEVGLRGHMTAQEAGEHGRNARARRLVLTHLTDQLDAATAEEAAERAFGGPVEIAREGAVYDV